MIDIVIRSGRFFSQKDEKALFDWLNSIEYVKDIRGIGDNLIVSIDNNIDKYSTMDLIAVICRYDLGMSDIKKKLGKIPRFKWINDDNMYWNNYL